MTELLQLNILSIGGFIFFLLIFLIGYIYVEILFGENYIFRKSLDRYQNNLFDRVVHYILWGIILNIISFLVIYNIGIENFIETINNNTNTTIISLKIFAIELPNIKELKFIIYSIIYFLFLIIALVSYGLISNLINKNDFKHITAKIKYFFKRKK